MIEAGHHPGAPSRTPADEKIAIQGELGSNSHRAALAFAESNAWPGGSGAKRGTSGEAIVPCVFSDEVLTHLTEGTVEWAVLPIENTLHGAVAEHYDLLYATEVQIVGELRLPIHHALLVPPGVPFKDVRRVFSHPVALSQCRRWFRAHPELEAVAFPDTAGAVRHVVEAGLSDAAALAPAAAAGLYGAHVLASAVEDDAANFTRFLLLRRGRFGSEQSDGPELAFSDAMKLTAGLRLRERSALGRALESFVDQGVEVLRVESRPIPGEPWGYLFFIEGALRSAARSAFSAEELTHSLARDCSTVRLLGVYGSLVQAPREEEELTHASAPGRSTPQRARK